MKKILCFGDSNTFGYRPQDGRRFGSNERWTGVLAQILGENYNVIEAGLNNRNCFTPSPFGGDYCGLSAISKYKGEYDLLIFALGINDLQFAYNPSVEEFEEGLNAALLYSMDVAKAKITILAAPPKLSEDILNGAFAIQFDEASIEKSQKLPPIYKRAAEKTGAVYLDLNEIVKVSPLDGLHFEKEAHRAIAEKLAGMILI